uniref:hypothetical protein n=1 Tax=Flavobacterium sp. TaxID=239 RepID=UPI00404B0FA2
MKFYLSLFCLFILTFGFSQTNDYILLKKINGIEIYYKIKRLKETKKKVDWLIEFEYVNSTNSDIFYKSIFVSPSTSETLFDSLLDTKTGDKEETQFCKINIENINGVFNSSASGGITGDKTRIKTDKNESILILKKNKTYTRSFEMRTNIEEEPIISITVINSISFTEDLKDFL